MKNAVFAERLRARETLYGALVSLPSPEVAEILLGAELDWIFLDLEHSAMSAIDAQRLLQIFQPRLPVLVRVEASDERAIRKALDLGPDGIIVPRVSSRDEAERVMKLAKYPPEGERSVGFGRASGYGVNFREYVSSANQSGLVILQAEDRSAADGIEDILSVPGLDGILVGPFDLSGSFKKLGQIDAPEVQAAIGKILAACKRRGIAAGIFAPTGVAAKTFAADGYTLLTVGTDAMFLARGLRTELEAAKR